MVNINKLIGLFGGFLLSSILDTTLGELNEWAIVGAALIVASLEFSSKLFYTVATRLNNSMARNSSLYKTADFLNSVKIGVIYGLIVDAFKLGS